MDRVALNGVLRHICNKDNGDFLIQFSDFSRGLHTVHQPHLNVHEDDIKTAAIAIGAVVNVYSEQITYWWSGTFTQPLTKADYTADEVLENGRDVSIEQAQEGIVLLMNSNNALPLAANERSVSLIGYGSHNPVYCGAGSVSWNTTGDRSDFYDAFTYYDFTINSGLRDYYTKNFGNRDTKEGQSEMTGGDFTIYDRNISEYESLLKAGGAVGDVAVVTLSRMGGENNDLPMDMGDEELLGGADLVNRTSSFGDAGKSYLELQQVELDMLKAVRENYSKVIVLLNTCNAMECGPVEEYADAILWIGQPGGRGTYSVVSVLTGETNPSGRMVDTYAYEHESAPTFYTSLAGTYQNFDEFGSLTQTVNGISYTIDNKVDGAVNYYYENIYVGYKWYETADAEGYWDGVSNQYGTGYDGVVQWPFGYGLSYTSFDWKVTRTKLGGVHDAIEIDVKVTNTGSAAGKDVVELYMAAPYTEYDKQNGVEKAAKDLVAFEKTGLLQPGESQTLTLTLDADELASYDAQGHGCYLAEAGDYYLYVSTDAHNVKSGCDPIVYTVDSDRVYNDSGVGKRSSDLVVAENVFDIAYTDGNIGTDERPYLSRKDFAGTNPNSFLSTYIRKMLISMGPDMVSYMQNSLGGSDVDLTAGDSYKDPNFVFAEGRERGIMIDEMAGVDYDSERWTEFVSQLTLEEMIGTLKEGFTGTLAISKVGVNATANTEGPSGVSSLNSNKAGNQYAAEPVTAATWNVELAAKVGSAIGKECVVGGFASINGPAMNTHRTPYGGRNGEYYSEDGFLAGAIGAAQVKAQQDEGVYCLIKHFAMNETDRGRGGMYTWTTEQAAREIYLVPFEHSVKEGGASGVMASYNRIGPMETCTCRGLNYDILRQEWGFAGTVATDGYSKDMTGNYMIIDNQLFAGAGTLLFIGDWAVENTGLTDNVLQSDYGKQVIFENAKNFLYRYANTGTGSIVLDLTPYWAAILVAVKLLLLGVILLITFKVTVPAFAGASGKAAAEKKSGKRTAAAAAAGIAVIAAVTGIVALNLYNTGKELRASYEGSAGTSDVTAAKVTGVTFDFQTGEYSFTGAEGAEEYRVRIFPVTDGVEEELPINESQAIRGGKSSYSGNLALWSLTAGNTYNAYVLADFENGATSISDPVTGTYIAEYAVITAGVEATIDGNTVTVSLNGDALDDSYDSGANYEITLLRDGSAVETKTLNNGDITAEAGEGSSAGTTYDAKLSFEVSDPNASYTVTVKALSVSPNYITSEESQPFAVTEAVEAPGEGETPAESEATSGDAPGGEEAAPSTAPGGDDAASGGEG